MLHPTFSELTQNDKFNRYELAIAAAKCARMVTDEYVKQREAAEKTLTGNKETDKPIVTMIDKELKDEKAVKIAIDRIYEGSYTIVSDTTPYEEAAEAEKAAKEETADSSEQ